MDIRLKGCEYLRTTGIKKVHSLRTSSTRSCSPNFLPWQHAFRQTMRKRRRVFRSRESLALHSSSARPRTSVIPSPQCRGRGGRAPSLPPSVDLGARLRASRSVAGSVASPELPACSSIRQPALINRLAQFIARLWTVEQLEGRERSLDPGG